MFFFIFMTLFLRITDSTHPHVGKTTLEMIQLNGYPSEVHNIVTEDGYILTMYRIPHGRKNNTKNGQPVLLMHGIVQSSADYVVMGPEKSLAFILADAGYDVWLGNARGNTYSKNHTFLHPNKKSFWDFSWHEIGYYDLASKIDYILYQTGYNKLNYVGHSQGCTAVLVLLSTKPEYNLKMNLVVLLAPCSHMKNAINPILYFGAKYLLGLIEIILESDLLFSHGELFPHQELTSKALQKICSETSPFRVICASLLFLVVGPSYNLMDYKMLPAELYNSPAGCSCRQVLHFGQCLATGKFKQYDFGCRRNFEKYGHSVPPRYKLWDISAPVAIFYSDYDWICSSKDIEHLYSELGNPVLLKKITEHIFNHIDFVWSSTDLIQKYVVDIMSRY